MFKVMTRQEALNGGHTQYISTSHCSNGHTYRGVNGLTKRYTANDSCVECAKEKALKWYDEHAISVAYNRVQNTYQSVLKNYGITDYSLPELAKKIVPIAVKAPITHEIKTFAKYKEKLYNCFSYAEHLSGIFPEIYDIMFIYIHARKLHGLYFQPEYLEQVTGKVQNKCVHEFETWFADLVLHHPYDEFVKLGYDKQSWAVVKRNAILAKDSKYILELNLNFDTIALPQPITECISVIENSNVLVH